MPKETFFNLPEPKRQRIIDLASKEFAANTFASASLSRIVEQAGIAKGSMYQYFADKFDLYAYVLKSALEKKMAFMQREMAGFGADADIFRSLLALTDAGARFAASEPELSDIAQNFLREGEDLKGRVMNLVGPVADATMNSWFRAAIDKGQLDPRIRPETASFILTAIIWGVDDEIRFGRLPVGRLSAFLEEVFDILKHGMRLSQIETKPEGRP